MEIQKYPEYEATKECARCKGSCCKYMPGHYSPADFADLSFEGLKAEIEKGAIAIDWWEAEQPEYYLRARQVGEDVVHGSWGGICVNLAPWGCRLSYENRPLGCRALKPRKSKRGDCVGSYGKEDCKNEWKNHDEVLRELVEYFGQQKTPLEERTESMLEALKWLSK